MSRTRYNHDQPDEHVYRQAIRTSPRRTPSGNSSSHELDQNIAPTDPKRQNLLNPINSQMSSLSLMSSSPSFAPPQAALPQSDEEQILSQELALCDFRAYLLALETRNRERLRQARGSECTCHEPALNPIDQHPHLRDYQMVIQAQELQQRRTQLQDQLERLTGRAYPVPDIYAQARDGPMQICGVSVQVAFPYF